MQDATLALVEIGNTDEVSAELGDVSLELFLSEFEARVGRLARPKDEILKLQPNKLCVLLRGVLDPLQIELAGAKLTRLFEPPIGVLDEEVRAAVHAAFVPPDTGGTDTKLRIRIAEAGLKEARQTGRTFVIRDAVPELASTAAFQRAREIELAFERGEFVMYFQPLVHAGYRTIVGAEGLMRWHDPREGVRSPADFLPYADGASIMRQLTWFALKACVGQCVTWPDPIGVSVNVSPLLLHDPELIPAVRDSLAIFGLEPARLTLEITEDAMIARPEEALLVLNELRDIGVGIAIDDFGTGYSSLANFRDLSVDELKVDRSFVSHMLKRPKDRDIVKAVIDLAHNFSMKVVAEGVEDEATADALQQLGADRLQGFWFSKPVTGDDFQKLLH